MPEIAEVETVRNILKKQVLNKRIKDVKILYDKMIENDSNEEFINCLTGEYFKDIKRRGKWLIFETEHYYLISHLRMEGKYFFKDISDPIIKHEHVIIIFDDNSTLRYHDTRKFGRMKVINKEELVNYEGIKKQGLEPNDSLLTKEYLYDKLKNKTLAIKTILLDQTIISGLGNIYDDEVLFASGINPTRTGKSITKGECDAIIQNAGRIINEAIKYGGTTIHSYTSSLGVTGEYQNKLLVHTHKDEPCPNCGTMILKIKVNGRGTYYCPNCQK